MFHFHHHELKLNVYITIITMTAFKEIYVLRHFWTLIFSKLCEPICFWWLRNRVNYLFFLFVFYFYFLIIWKSLKIAGWYLAYMFWNICHWIIFRLHLHKLNLNVFITIITICTWERHICSYFTWQTLKFAYY